MWQRLKENRRGSMFVEYLIVLAIAGVGLSFIAYQLFNPVQNVHQKQTDTITDFIGSGY